ncbi:hypothetical protein J7K42_02010 [bacterium]|nr:hypothetical protein [bacterium]
MFFKLPIFIGIRNPDQKRILEEAWREMKRKDGLAAKLRRKRIKTLKRKVKELEKAKKTEEAEKEKIRRKLEWIEELLSKTKIQEVRDFLYHTEKRLKEVKQKMQSLEKEDTSVIITQEIRIRSGIEELISELKKMRKRLNLNGRP